MAAATSEMAFRVIETAFRNLEAVFSTLEMVARNGERMTVRCGTLKNITNNEDRIRKVYGWRDIYG